MAGSTQDPVSGSTSDSLILGERSLELVTPVTVIGRKAPLTLGR